MYSLLNLYDTILFRQSFSLSTVVLTLYSANFSLFTCQFVIFEHYFFLAQPLYITTRK